MRVGSSARKMTFLMVLFGDFELIRFFDNPEQLFISFLFCGIFGIYCIPNEQFWLEWHFLISVLRVSSAIFLVLMHS